ncbi:MAG TPA: universal stress protein [Ktedonobacterales bacterium]|nr:universal stress protein [Ktedonobacterales bacterium]
MFKRIIVPLDGTPFSEAALAPASALARAFDASVVLVRAVATRDPTHTALDRADRYLHDVIARLHAERLVSGIDIYAASPSVSIASAAELEHADVIVMTVHPRWMVDLLDDTSTTVQVLAQSDVPILIWRASESVAERHESARDPLVPLLGRTECPIIVPLDGTAGAETAIPVAEALVRRFGSYLVLASAIEEISPTLPTAAPAVESPYEYLQRVQRKVQHHGVGVIIAVHRGRPEQAIDQIWREYDASLVVMASRRRDCGGTGLLDSVAVRMIEELTIPMLVVRSSPDAPVTTSPHN